MMGLEWEGGTRGSHDTTIVASIPGSGVELSIGIRELNSDL
jgi:hypothetical protein